MQRRRLPIWMSLVVLGGACAGGSAELGAPSSKGRSEPVTIPERQAFVREMGQKFPASGFLVGIGESDASAEGAESRAIADAAAAIRSSVERTFSAEETGTFGGGVGKIDTRTLDQIKQKVETDAGAYIRPRRELTRRTSGGWLAVAVASRDELDAKYVEDARSISSRLFAVQDRILSARSWFEAAPAWCEVQDLEAKLQLLSQERLVVSGKVLWTPELQERSRKVHAVRSQAKASTKVSVLRLQPATEADPSDLIVKALRALGWAASSATGASCGDGGLLLKPSLTRDCRHSSLGIELCDVTLHIEGQACGSSSALFTSSRTARGTDSQDPARAERAARKKLEVKEAAQDATGRTLNVLGECKP